MTTALAQRRARLATRMALIAAISVGVAFITLSIQARSLRPPTSVGLVLPELAARIGDAQRVTLTTADGAMTIVRTRDGWVMRDRDDYPVRPEAMEQLAEALTTMALRRRMTTDPENYPRIGVDDPAAGGRGVLVQIENAAGAFLADLYVGEQTAAGDVFVRRANEAQAWAASADLPALQDPATWLDLTPLTLDPAQVARVDIAPAAGRGYALARPTAPVGEPQTQPQPFGFAPPLSALAPRSVFELTQTAERLAALAPIDVRAAQAISGEVRARLTALTTTGVAIQAEIIAAEGGSWLKLTAAAPPDAAEAVLAEAQAINARAQAWAYQLTDAEAAQLAPALETLLPPPEPPPGL